MYCTGPGIDNKLRSASGAGVSYFLADHLGSTNGLVDASGALTASNSYDSFGNPSNPNFPTRYQFTGREYDNFTGLQYSRARYYDPKIGRFISEDPIGFNGGDVSLYGYVLNSPVRFNDPTGLQRQDRDRPGDMYPGMREPYNPNRPGRSSLSEDMRALACAADGYNPWITLEVGGGLQFGPFGGSDAIVLGFNPLTSEIAGQTKLMSGNGAALGLLGTAGMQIGLSLGPASSSVSPSPAGEVFGDGAAFGGGSGSLGYDGSFGIGVGFGPVLGGGAAGGLRVGEVSPLFSFGRSSCSCRR
ncbi:MAG: RHS repeat-associated core domain-containing protein [Acidobacteria bacterium]|nr:RHS repeat-associated core domain-containing protein [Acidobacteriota bacterium]